MIGEQLIERKFLNLVEVKDLLAKRKKEKELTYEQDMALKYSKQFAKLTPAMAHKAMKELMELEGMADETAIKVVDILPTEMPLLKMLVPKEAKISEGSLAKALEISQKYAKEKKEDKEEKEEKEVKAEKEEKQEKANE